MAHLALMTIASKTTTTKNGVLLSMNCATSKDHVASSSCHSTIPSSLSSEDTTMECCARTTKSVKTLTMASRRPAGFLRMMIARRSTTRTIQKSPIIPNGSVKIQTPKLVPCTWKNRQSLAQKKT
jgi:hypothetical protein